MGESGAQGSEWGPAAERVSPLLAVAAVFQELLIVHIPTLCTDWSLENFWRKKNIYMFVWNRHADNNIFGEAQKLLTSTGSLLLFAAGLINFILFILGEYKDGNDDDDDDGQINTENKIITIVSQRLICIRVFVSTLLTRLSIVQVQQLANAIYLHKGCYCKCLPIFIYFLIFLRMCSLSIFVLKNKK